jgi:hypothetical protein
LVFLKDIAIAMRKLFVVAIVILTTVLFLVSPVAAYRVTLVGKVNDNHQFVADGETYEIDDNAAGEDLILNYLNMKVKAVGILRETRKYKIIKIESFEVVED